MNGEFRNSAHVICPAPHSRAHTHTEPSPSALRSETNANETNERLTICFSRKGIEYRHSSKGRREWFGNEYSHYFYCWVCDLCVCRTMTENRRGLTKYRLPVLQVLPLSFGFKGVAAHLCLVGRLSSRNLLIIFLYSSKRWVCGLDLPAYAVFYPRAYE